MYVANLHVRAPVKLAHLRELAGQHGGTWRDHRKTYRDRFAPETTSYNPPCSNYGEKHCRWVEQPHKVLRLVGFADEIARHIDHTGWFTNQFQDEVYRGIVYQLPARDGQPRFAYGYADPNNDGAFLSFDPCDDRDDAARWADHVAQVAAEEEREYQIKESAKLRQEDIAAELATIRADLIELCRQARQVCSSLADAPAVKDAIRRRIAAALDKRAELRAERDRLERDPYSIAY